MPSPSLAAIRASNAAFFRSSSSSSLNSTTIPTAVFVGGTSGIGEGMAVAFAQHTEGKSNIILVGRNHAAAERILASLPSPPPSPASSTKIDPKPAREFIQCDATLMENVNRASSEILAQHPKINYLVLTPGFSTLSGRDETPEGIDKKLAVHYYARWKFLYDLLPGLERAKEAGEQAAAISVMAAGRGGEVDLEDLGLKRGYTLSKVAKAAPTYNDLMIESFAERAPSLTFIHAYPGIVRTSLGSSSPSPTLRLLSPLVLPLFRPFSVSHLDCGEYMWYGLTGTAKGRAGAWRTWKRGEDLGKEGYFGGEEAKRRLWEHTLEVMRDALGEEGGQAGKLSSA